MYSEPGQLEAVFAAMDRAWGRLDFALHAIAFAPKDDLHGRLTDCSRDGFLLAMDISCHSFMRMVRLAEPLMHDGGTLFTMSYYGAEKVIEHYNVMGPVKAALESAVRYLAYELGPRHPRARDLSRAGDDARCLRYRSLRRADGDGRERAPERHLVSIEDVGAATAFLATDYAKLITGETVYVDGGYHIVG